MSALEQIAHFQNRRDEVPNQELARRLAAKKDRAGIREIAQNLFNKDKAIQADCIKVLYEVGYINPSLVAEYAEDFVKLLRSKNNRMVWGGMIALGIVAALKPDVVLEHLEEIKRAMSAGSVITVDNAVQALAGAASRGDKYSKAMFPWLLQHLKSCRPKEVPQHSERALAAVNAGNKAKFLGVLNERLGDLSGSGLARVKKVIRQAEGLGQAG
jgi:hypothetical protein